MRTKDNGEKTIHGEKTMNDDKTINGEKTINDDKTINSEKTIHDDKTINSEKTINVEKTINGSMKSRKRKIKKKKMRRKKLVLFAAAFICLLVLGIIIYIKIPSNVPVDFEQYFDRQPGIAYGLIIDKERVGSYPVKREGYWYLDLDTVHYYITDKFYYDGTGILYTNPTTTYTAKQAAYLYKDEDGLAYQLSYQPWYVEHGKIYLALEYIQLMHYDEYFVDTEKQYMWIQTNWEETNTALLKKDEMLRSGSGIKKEIVEEVAKGERVVILETGKSWSLVQTPRGLIGCVRNKVLGETELYAAKRSDKRPLPIYSTQMLEETICMAWHQVFTESGYKQLDKYLEHAGDYLNVICPTWFTVSDDTGNLQSLADEEYVKRMHEEGIQVWGMLANIDIPVDESKVLGVTANRKRLIDAVMEEAKRVDLDGINLDFEEVGAQNGAHLLQFIRELSAACRKAGLVLSVDNYSPMPHTAFYDRAQQAEIVDYIIVMAYDEYYAGGQKEGSTASIGWVKQSAERTLLEVPKEKLIIGLPVYTRLWNRTPAAYAEADAKLFTDENGEQYSLTSKGIGMEGCDNVVRQHGLGMTWLEEEGQYYVEYQEGHSTYRLWIEDENSMELKLATAFSYEPAGIAFFKLGLENADTWVKVKPYLD